MKRKSVSVPPDLAGHWSDAAEDLGYGRHGRIKLLRIMLQVAEEMPTLFRKR